MNNWQATDGRERGKRMRRVLLVVFLAGLVAGAGRMLWEGRPITVEGMDGTGKGRGAGEFLVEVAAFPERKSAKQQALLISQSAGREAEKFIGVFSWQQRLEYGDRLLIKAVKAEIADLTEGQRFGLLRSGAGNYLEKITVLKRLGTVQGGWFGLAVLDPMKVIYRVRTFLLEKIMFALPEPAGSLINGILIGERGNLSAEVAEDFQITGLTHILAISGFNITIIINLVLMLSAQWSKSRRFLVSLGVISFFVVLTGASASVIRAGVMGLLMLLVKISGRRAPVFKVLLMSAFLILMINPFLLDFDLSFQLSVTATLSLVWFSPFLEKKWESAWQEQLWTGISTTLAAQVITLPLMFYNFGRISLISPLANLVVGPFIPVLMILGSLLLGTTVLVPVLNPLLAGMTDMLVRGILKIVGLLADFPLAQLELGQGQLWLVILYYSLVFILFFRRQTREPDSAAYHVPRFQSVSSREF
jgi:ComEC/Rec2-related protein